MGTRAEVRVGLCGALGGATNAWLCFARIPAAVKDDPHFAWHVVPAGALHGGFLAGIAFSLGIALSTRSLRARLIAALPLAWVAGFVSWIPLNRSAFDEPWLKSLTWPLHDGWGASMLGPLQYFGFVALFYYAAVTFYLVRARSLILHMAFASVAGILGSLWWWSAMEPWYFSVLHGAIWGTFVGIGAWTGLGGRGPFASVGALKPERHAEIIDVLLEHSKVLGVKEARPDWRRPRQDGDATELLLDSAPAKNQVPKVDVEGRGIPNFRALRHLLHIPLRFVPQVPEGLHIDLCDEIRHAGHCRPKRSARCRARAARNAVGVVASTVPNFPPWPIMATTACGSKVDILHRREMEGRRPMTLPTSIS